MDNDIIANTYKSTVIERHRRNRSRQSEVVRVMGSLIDGGGWVII